MPEVVVNVVAVAAVVAEEKVGVAAEEQALETASSAGSPRKNMPTSNSARSRALEVHVVAGSLPVLAVLTTAAVVKTACA